MNTITTIITILFLLACAGVCMKFAMLFRRAYHKASHSAQILQAGGFMWTFSALSIAIAAAAVIVAWAGF